MSSQEGVSAVANSFMVRLNAAPGVILQGEEQTQPEPNFVGRRAAALEEIREGEGWLCLRSPRARVRQLRGRGPLGHSPLGLPRNRVVADFAACPATDDRCRTSGRGRQSGSDAGARTATTTGGSLTSTSPCARPTSRGRLVWYALRTKTIDLINEHVHVEIPQGAKRSSSMRRPSRTS